MQVSAAPSGAAGATDPELQPHNFAGLACKITRSRHAAAKAVGTRISRGVLLPNQIDGKSTEFTRALLYNLKHEARRRA